MTNLDNDTVMVRRRIYRNYHRNKKKILSQIKFITLFIGKLWKSKSVFLV